jgi:dTDP-4-amino-4,6-dideoxygalactose transaminase
LAELRVRHDRRFREVLADCPVQLPAPSDDVRRSAMHLFIIRLEPDRTSWTRDRFIEALQERGIQPSVHFIPVHLHPFYAQMGYRRGMFPAAERAFDQAISLPFYPTMSDDTMERLLDITRAMLIDGPGRSATPGS